MTDKTSVYQYPSSECSVPISIYSVTSVWVVIGEYTTQALAPGQWYPDGDWAWLTGLYYKYMHSHRLVLVLLALPAYSSAALQ